MDFTNEISLTAVNAKLNKGILYITLNRPDKLNALSIQLLADLKIIVSEIYSQKNIKAAIIMGAGEKAFVAGADISEFSNLSKEGASQMAANGAAIFKTIEQCPKPIVAAVNGFALGGGCELAMACHIRIATDTAKFGQPEVNLGLIPGYGGTQRLVQLIGKTKALELQMTADIINAQLALSLGLVNYVVAPIELLNKAEEIINKILTKSPNAIAGIIASVNAYYQEGVDGFDFETKTFGECFAHSDSKEGTQAFLEKRKPVF